MNQVLYSHQNQTTPLRGKFHIICNLVGQFKIINCPNLLTLQMCERTVYLSWLFRFKCYKFQWCTILNVTHFNIVSFTVHGGLFISKMLFISKVNGFYYKRCFFVIQALLEKYVKFVRKWWQQYKTYDNIKGDFAWFKSDTGLKLRICLQIWIKLHNNVLRYTWLSFG